ncbi:MAG: hypothetical protein A2Y03_06630 [Omnitrophica WOR_2 bacterium GWF2_38_59]|nr:MAG: hypothetical protein A2Y03_06630 [Omnitrophica WOR_2 bacterium GWF2_38_59]OGX50474.1 MAG: hypothetical protein A2243_01945 [Omnitrophica WOR_2 bacterium RIFOXYA2_FULL_38_17]OGX51563.1 MAG: hypothetical protein A2267_08825 [Omnitrophica WOR_2 bacterium RIFOXYA12_FULL_38_10]OGX59483.1 MAG: hypothetical protein A2306_09570 [Omnitrophica WOR_2 bacterium RIFOXYB2_FULL_38_16]HBG62051.1 hypothetical protein [Candidatus Omnitrophota bacterium]
MKRKFILILVLFLFTGCAPLTYRTNSAFDTYFKEKKRVLVLSPDMKIYKLTAGGVDQYQEDWSFESNKYMKDEIKSELDSFKTIDFAYLDTNSLGQADKQFIDEQKSIYYTVASSVVVHTYEPALLMKHKLKDFDYTMGIELSEIKNIQDAEVILFVSGRNYIWTAGRASLAFLSGAVGLFTGVYLPVPAGKELLAASLVDVKTGDILWFNYLAMPGDMRMEKTVRRLSKKLFRDFPEEWRDTVRWELRKEQGNE